VNNGEKNREGLASRHLANDRALLYRGRLNETGRLFAQTIGESER